MNRGAGETRRRSALAAVPAIGAALLAIALFASLGRGGASANSAVFVSFGGDHTCVLDGVGGVSCVGGGSYGQLGNGMTKDSSAFVRVMGLNSGVLSIRSGPYNTCAITVLHSLLCWGDNFYGQLGVGTTTDSPIPVQFQGAIANVAQVAIGQGFICAVLLGGTDTCSGANFVGQLGIGDSTGPEMCGDQADQVSCSTTPVAVPGLTAQTGITAGVFDACSWNVTGHPNCWGINEKAELGQGSTTGPDQCGPTHVACGESPVPLTLPPGVTDIEGGGEHFCAIGGGNVWCWGESTYLQSGPGNGACNCVLTPSDMPGAPSGITEVALGRFHTCFKTPSSTECVGYNGDGAFGDGSVLTVGCKCTGTPTQVPGASGVTHIFAGGDNTCILTASGAASCTGYDASGQLGDGTTGDSACYCLDTLVPMPGFDGTTCINPQGAMHAADASPTDTPAPTCPPSASPAPPTLTPTPTPAVASLWGDVDCSGGIDPEDALLALKGLADATATPQVPTTTPTPTCSRVSCFINDVSTALSILKFVAHIAFATPTPCPK